MELLHRSHRGVLFALLLLAPLLALSPRTLHAGEAEDRLRLLADEEHEGYAAALAWWEAYKPHAQVALLRRTLVGKDVPAATITAEALGAEYLDNSELRRRMSLLHPRPLSMLKSAPALHDWGLGEGLRAWGAADLVPFFQGVVADETGEFEDIGLDSWHRVMHPRHVVGLVPLLDKGGPKVFKSVLWHVAMCGEYDREDRYRAQVARGLLYGLQRMRAQRAEKPVPGLTEAVPDVTSPPGGGLPEAYLTLAWALYPREGKWKVRLDVKGPPGDLELRSSYFWLRRWAQDLTPAAKDLPYLKDLVEVAETSDHRMLRWAVGHMAGLPGKDGVERVKAWAQGADRKAAYAAAALAERGAPERYHALRKQVEAAEGEEPALVRAVLQDLLWSVDRRAALEAWVAGVLVGDAPEFDQKSGLSADGRWNKERFDGVVVTPDDMAWIESALWTRGASTPTLAWFHGSVWPESLTPERTAALFERLHEMKPLDWEERNPEGLLPLLALLEVRDEARLIKLLRYWLETQVPIRSTLLQWLARLGDAASAAAMVEDWTQWEMDERWLLGLVKDKAVNAFLATQLAGDKAEFVVPAMLALLVRAGLPAACARELRYSWKQDLDEAPLPEILGLVRAGDMSAAVLRAARETGLHLLGLVKDERAVAALRGLRDDRSAGRYRAATAGLAITGDVQAQREMQALLEDDRLWLIEDLADDLWSFLPHGPMTTHWVSRLDSNCCLGWRAMVALREIYPTIPFDDAYGGAGTRRTRDWLTSQRFARSRLLDGLVPAGP